MKPGADPHRPRPLRPRRRRGADRPGHRRDDRRHRRALRGAAGRVAGDAAALRRGGPGRRRRGRVTPPSSILRGVEIDGVKHLHSAATNVAGDGQAATTCRSPRLRRRRRSRTRRPQRTWRHLLGHLPDDEGGIGPLPLPRRRPLARLARLGRPARRRRAPGARRRSARCGPSTSRSARSRASTRFTNGMRDPRHYIEALAPDDLRARPITTTGPLGITTKGESYREPFYAALERRSPPSSGPRCASSPTRPTTSGPSR